MWEEEGKREFFALHYTVRYDKKKNDSLASLRRKKEVGGATKHVSW